MPRGESAGTLGREAGKSGVRSRTNHMARPNQPHSAIADTRRARQTQIALRAKRIKSFPAISGAQHLLYYLPRESPQAATNLRHGPDGPLMLICLMISRRNWVATMVIRRRAGSRSAPAPRSDVPRQHHASALPQQRKGERRYKGIRRDAHRWRVQAWSTSTHIRCKRAISVHPF